MSQALRAPALAALLQLVPMAPGSKPRVLELDTDWQDGASAVELAARCGGSVESLSHSPVAVNRARAAHANNGLVQFRRRSLVEGWPAGGPYDLVLVWPLMNLVPRAWVAQCAPGGRLLCPVFLHGPSGGFAVLRLTVAGPGQRGEAVAATMSSGPWPGAVRWTMQPAVLEAVDDGHLVRCDQVPAAEEPIDRRTTHGGHRNAG